MNLLPFENSLYMRFDTFCKKVLRTINYKLLSEEHKRRERGCVFSDLPEKELEKYFFSYDSYPSLLSRLTLKNIQVFIENEMLYHALILLPEKKLEIIILSFFADMTDKEISEKINMPLSTVQYNRNAALRYIRKFMGVDIRFDEKQETTK